MKTIYIICSNDYITINEYVNKILKEKSLNRECLIKYDLSEAFLDQVISDLDTYNFLVPTKVVVCDNCYFLSGNKPRGTIEQNIDKFLKYLDNPSNDNILVLLVDKLDERKNVVKKLKEIAIILDEEIAINKIIKSKLDGFKMDDNVINYLINYCNNDNEKILNELEKLKCYKYNEKVINYDDIDNIVLKSFGDNIFTLIDAIMKKNKKKAVMIYNDLLKSGEDLNKIVAMLAEQFRIIYNGRILLDNYHNDYKEVASLMGVQYYRLRKAIESGYNYSAKSILDTLSKLDEIEIKIKTGKNITVVFENFIYSL